MQSVSLVGGLGVINKADKGLLLTTTQNDRGDEFINLEADRRKSDTNFSESSTSTEEVTNNLKGERGREGRVEASVEKRSATDDKIDESIDNGKKKEKMGTSYADITAKKTVKTSNVHHPSPPSISPSSSSSSSSSFSQAHSSDLPLSINTSPKTSSSTNNPTSSTIPQVVASSIVPKNEAFVNLISSENDVFTMSKECAFESRVIERMCRGLLLDGDSDRVVFPTINTKVLERVVAYLYYKHHTKQSGEVATAFNEFSIPDEIAMDLLLTASFLEL